MATDGLIGMNSNDRSNQWIIRILLAVPILSVLGAGLYVAFFTSHILREDKMGYFAWGYALLTSGEIDPGPTLLKLDPRGFDAISINGRRTFNKYPIGWSLATFPGMVVGRAVAAWQGLTTDDPRMLVRINEGARLAAIGWALVGIVCAYTFVSRLTSPMSAAWGMFLAWLGTSALGYTCRELNMSHVISLALAAIAYDAAGRTNSSRRPWIWAAMLGLAASMLGCTRLVNLILVLPAFVLLTLGPGGTRIRWRLAMVAVIAMLPPLLLQSAIWKHLYGVWYFNGYAVAGEHFVFNPANVLRLLISTRHGLFIWHPIACVAILGLVISVQHAKTSREEKWFSISCLAAVGGISLVYGSWWVWWLEASFGARWAADAFILWALGLSLFIERWLCEASWRAYAGLIVLALISAGLISGQVLRLIAPDQFLQLYLPGRGWYVLP